MLTTELEIRGRPTRVGINSVRGGLGKTCSMIYTMIIYIFTSNFTRNQLALFASFHIIINKLAPVLKRPIGASPGLKFCSTFCIYLPIHGACNILCYHFFSFFFQVKEQKYFVSSSYMFLD